MVKGPYLLLERRYLLNLGVNYEEPGVVCHEGSRIVSPIPFFWVSRPRHKAREAASQAYSIVVE